MKSKLPKLVSILFLSSSAILSGQTSTESVVDSGSVNELGNREFSMQRERMRERYETLTPEQQEQIKAFRSQRKEKLKSKWDSLSEEEKAQARERFAENRGNGRRADAPDYADREQLRSASAEKWEARKERYEGLSDEEKAMHRENKTLRKLDRYEDRIDRRVTTGAADKIEDRVDRRNNKRFVYRNRAASETDL